MTTGVVIRRATDGVETLRIEDRITRLVGTINTGSSSGSVLVSGPANSLIWVSVIDTQGDSNTTYAPRIIVNQAQRLVTWDYLTGSANSRPVLIAYGLY